MFILYSLQKNEKVIEMNRKTKIIDFGEKEGRIDKNCPVPEKHVLPITVNNFPEILELKPVIIFYKMSSLLWQVILLFILTSRNFKNLMKYLIYFIKYFIKLMRYLK